MSAAATSIDDRMACAVVAINAKLAAKGRYELYDFELRQLRGVRYSVFVGALAFDTGLDFSEALALLHGWHAWHGGL